MNVDGNFTVVQIMGHLCNSQQLPEKLLVFIFIAIYEKNRNMKKSPWKQLAQLHKCSTDILLPVTLPAWGWSWLELFSLKVGKAEKEMLDEVDHENQDVGMGINSLFHVSIFNCSHCSSFSSKFEQDIGNYF